MRYCKRCLQPDTRPNITFDENGVCPPCNYSEVVKKLNGMKEEQTSNKLLNSRNQIIQVVTIV